MLRTFLSFSRKFVLNVGDDLSLQEAALQLLSARMSLTTVFGKGTGGPSA